MGGVLGVSVGSGFVRIVRHPSPGAHSDAVGLRECRTLVVGDHDPEKLAAEAVGVLLAGDEYAGSADAVAIAYTDESQAAALDAAMRREGVADYRLIPELSAVLEQLAATGLLSGLGAVVVLDLGYTGSTVSVVDVESGTVRATERTALCVAEIGGVVDLADELLTQTGCGADAVVLVGGGATAAAIRERVADLAGLPVVVPEDPELSAASGAALVASSAQAPAESSQHPTAHRRTGHRPGARRRGSRRAVSRRQVRSAGAAGVMLALLAVIGFGLGYGRTLFGSAPDESAGKPVTSSVTIASAPPSAPPSSPVATPESLPVEAPLLAPPAGSRPVANGAPRQSPSAQPAPDPLGTVLDALTGLPNLPPLPPLDALPPLESLPLPPIPQVPGL
ncbi:hypothetical protein FNU77_16165 [Prescottella equi]|uniref:FGGY-family carbohydrate kinase n=1 Tax=Rhodococcus hoagii TaxID=43767 RepID=UPI000A10B1CC|nr:FGGY-family carbohydrate kinase [Prescottella equi]ORM02406.1 hypothetical protein A5N69_02265 [Prescottella equi]ORM19899.1 hypothetical protein A5N74_07900 [Prescottella equi]QDP11132.1 hypothetical protein FNU77_16165 [Prescottella equi]